MKYFIIPNNVLASTVEAGSKEAAMLDFAATMDSDMNSYFKAVTEEEYLNIKKDNQRNEHRQFVIDWMAGALESDFGMTEKSANDWAARAYEIYCEGDGLTEYAAVEKAHEEFVKDGGIQ